MSPSPISTSEDRRVLSPAQEAVIALISAGSTIVAAAEAAGVHRNTVLNWRRHFPHFRVALWRAEEEKALFWREKAEELASSALETLRTILADQSASASVRLKAALHVLNQVSTPPPVTEDVNACCAIILEAESAAPGTHETVHNSAQPQQPEAHRLTPKVGRNDYCPCGSGKKYKRCCMEKENPRPGGLTSAAARITEIPSRLFNALS